MTRHYETCDAPICQEFDEGIWYPNEPICVKRPFKKFQKNQIKIRKLPTPVEGYFTKAKLERLISIRPGIRGIDPEPTVMQRSRGVSA